MTQTTSSVLTLRSLIAKTVAMRQSKLPNAALEWAVNRGYAEYASVTAECIDSQEWRDDWRDDTGGSWPTYLVKLEVNGVNVGEVVGWHYAGMYDNMGSNEWGILDKEGDTCGLPVYQCNRMAGPHIDSPSHSDLELPLLNSSGQALLYDEYEVNRSIEEAAADAGHGSEPSIDELDKDSDGEDWDCFYTVRNYEIREITVSRLVKYCEGSDYDRGFHRPSYLLEGYTITDPDYPDADYGIHEYAEDAINAWSVEHGEQAYKDEDDAQFALAAVVDEQLAELDELPGMEYGRDRIGETTWGTGRGEAGQVWIAPADREDEGEVYHLDDEQTARVCRFGWNAIIDEIREAFGTRQALAAIRSWQEEMDGAIAVTDPWVTLDDSLASGNCRAMSVQFRDQLSRHLGATGEVGAVRASMILGLRDDPFTRRACRMAMQRAIEGR